MYHVEGDDRGTKLADRYLEKMTLKGRATCSMFQLLTQVVDTGRSD